MTNTTANAIYTNADGTSEFVNLDETGCVYAIISQAAEADLDALHAGEHADYRIASREIEVGDGDTYAMLQDRTTRTAGDIAESIADEVLGKIRTTRLNGGAGATNEQVRGFVSVAINHRYQDGGLNVLVGLTTRNLAARGSIRRTKSGDWQVVGG